MEERIKKKRLVSILFEHLTPVFNEQGFKTLKSLGNGGFELHKEGIRYRCLFRILSYFDFSLNFFLGIRFNTIEEIVLPYSNISVEGWKNSDTLTTSCLDLVGSTDIFGPYREIYEEKDILAEIPTILTHMEQYIFPFFTTYSDIKLLNQMFNIDFYTEEKMGIGLFGGRELRALVIAKLCGQENYEQLINIHYNTYLIEIGSRDKDEATRRFFSLVEKLKTVQPLVMP